jgi:hypothetical protein
MVGSLQYLPSFTFPCGARAASCAADSAATIEALKRPGVAEPAKAGDTVVAPKQDGAQGFYKVWVSDGPIEFG